MYIQSLTIQSHDFPRSSALSLRLIAFAMRTADVRVARPLVVLCVALVCQLSAGMLYWWPALTSGLQSALSLSNSGATALVATANSGSVLGILGGIFHDHFGSRKTAVAGSAGISLCFLSLALLVAFPLPSHAQSLTLWICLLVTVAIVMFAYMLYSSCITAAAAVFGKRYRGRVVGLSAAMYGASAGVFGALQAALFPSIAQTRELLLFFSAFSVVPALLAAATFPDTEVYAVETPSAPAAGYRAVQLAEAESSEDGDDASNSDAHISARLVLAYRVAWALVVTLQATAVSSALELSTAMQRICATAVTVAIMSLFLIPVGSSLVVHEEEPREAVLSEPEPPFSVVARDWRYIYLCFGFFALVGGGGVAVLVQAPGLVASRMYEHAMPAMTKWDPEEVSRGVRSFVVLFSAFNVMARLFIGGVMDWGENAVERHKWKNDIMLTDAFVMTCALLGIAFAKSWALFLAVAFVGFCHGTWFASTPALTTLWFGVQSFPRNYALVGPFAAVGSATLASTMPSLFRSKFGDWTVLHVKGGHPDELERVCTGLMCSIPTFCVLAALQCLMYILGRRLRPLVAREAECCGY